MVSHSAYASDLVQLATGWLDWTFDQAMHSDCGAILLAYQGKEDMLKAIYGAEPNDEELRPLRSGMLG